MFTHPLPQCPEGAAAPAAAYDELFTGGSGGGPMTFDGSGGSIGGLPIRAPLHNSRSLPQLTTPNTQLLPDLDYEARLKRQRLAPGSSPSLRSPSLAAEGRHRSAPLPELARLQCRTPVFGGPAPPAAAVPGRAPLASALVGAAVQGVIEGQSEAGLLIALRAGNVVIRGVLQCQSMSGEGHPASRPVPRRHSVDSASWRRAWSGEDPPLFGVGSSLYPGFGSRPATSRRPHQGRGMLGSQSAVFPAAAWGFPIDEATEHGMPISHSQPDSAGAAVQRAGSWPASGPTPAQQLHSAAGGPGPSSAQLPTPERAEAAAKPLRRDSGRMRSPYSVFSAGMHASLAAAQPLATPQEIDMTVSETWHNMPADERAQFVEGAAPAQQAEHKVQPPMHHSQDAAAQLQQSALGAGSSQGSPASEQQCGGTSEQATLPQSRSLLDILLGTTGLASQDAGAAAERPAGLSRHPSYQQLEQATETAAALLHSAHIFGTASEGGSSQQSPHAAAAAAAGMVRQESAQSLIPAIITPSKAGKLASLLAAPPTATSALLPMLAATDFVAMGQSTAVEIMRKGSPAEVSPREGAQPSSHGRHEALTPSMEGFVGHQQQRHPWQQAATAGALGSQAAAQASAIAAAEAAGRQNPTYSAGPRGAVCGAVRPPSATTVVVPASLSRGIRRSSLGALHGSRGQGSALPPGVVFLPSQPGAAEHLQQPSYPRHGSLAAAIPTPVQHEQPPQDGGAAGDARLNEWSFRR